MKLGRNSCVLAVAVLLLACSAFADQKHRAGFTLAEDAQVGSTQLKAGDYKLEWTGDGNVQLEIKKGSKTVATVPAQVVQQKEPAVYNDVVLKPLDGGGKTIDQIDFANKKESLKLEAQASGM